MSSGPRKQPSGVLNGGFILIAGGRLVARGPKRSCLCEGEEEGRPVDAKPDRRLLPCLGRQTTGTAEIQEASGTSGFGFQYHLSVQCVFWSLLVQCVASRHSFCRASSVGSVALSGCICTRGASRQDRPKWLLCTEETDG